MSNKYVHFGIEFDEEKIPKNISKENFVDKTLDRNKWLTDYAKQEAEKNYDLNMEYFKTLDNEEFNKVLSNLLDSYTFIEIQDLNDLKGRKGIYILVLDNYKQIYIGQTINDLKHRIIRHFQIRIPYQRVPFVRYDTLPIDSFKPKDTTRIYVLYTKEQDIMDQIEMKLIEIVPKQFLLNKTIGGKPNSLFELAVRLSIGRISKDVSLPKENDNLEQTKTTN